KARHATVFWLLAGPSLGLPRDVVRIIGRMLFASRDNVDSWKEKPPVPQKVPDRFQMENVAIPDPEKSNLRAKIDPDATRVEMSDTEVQALEEEVLMAVTAESTDAYETKIDIREERRDA